MVCKSAFSHWLYLFFIQSLWVQGTFIMFGPALIFMVRKNGNINIVSGKTSIFVGKLFCIMGIVTSFALTLLALSAHNAGFISLVLSLLHAFFFYR
jgi:hypothetical protein